MNTQARISEEPNCYLLRLLIAGLVIAVRPSLNTMTDHPTQKSRPRVLSGMRPTGKLHLGNYVGALQNWVKLQKTHDCFFFVADWHALTTDYDNTSQLADNTLEVVLDFLAAGLDPEQVRHLCAVACARACRAAPALFHDHAAGMAGARSLF